MKTHVMKNYTSFSNFSSKMNSYFNSTSHKLGEVPTHRVFLCVLPQYSLSGETGVDGESAGACLWSVACLGIGCYYTLARSGEALSLDGSDFQ